MDWGRCRQHRARRTRTPGCALCKPDSERVGEVVGHGPAILRPIGQDRILVLGGGGGRIFFHISEPGAWGIGNGYLQDILFRARVHPKRRVVELDKKEGRALYDSIVETLGSAVELGGRDTERDLYGRPGGYRRILHSKVTGEPCPACGAPIEKIHYLGGASYFCPRCQR